MKLVAAKCPSCNANIEVDKNSDSTKCEFCNTKIIVEDAIAKYKVEVLGEVSIKNMPKLDNFLKLGERHYQDKEYEEAYDNYSKASELDPDNWLVILRKGICKTLCTNYLNFEYKPAINGVKNAYNILKKDDKKNEINQAVKEANQTIIELVGFVVNHYKSNDLYIDDINEANIRLLACIDAYEYLNTIVEDDELKKQILTSLIYAIERLLEGKRYNTGNYNRHSNPIIQYSFLDSKLKKYWSDKKSQYTYEKNMLDPEFAKKQNEIGNKNEQLEKKSNRLCYVGVAFYFILFISAIKVGAIVSSIFFLLGAIIFVPYIKNKLVSKDEKWHKKIIIGRWILWLIGGIFLPEVSTTSLTPYEGEWVSENGMELTIEEYEVELKTSDGEKIKDSLVEYVEAPYDDYINIYYELVVNKYDEEEEEITFRYTKYADGSKEFCIIEKDECTTYFVPKKADSSAKYITSNKDKKEESE